VVQRLHEGPRMARVEGVEVEELRAVADLPAMTVTA
jgi:hypothetical protein